MSSWVMADPVGAAEGTVTEATDVGAAAWAYVRMAGLCRFATGGAYYVAEASPTWVSPV